MLRTRFFLVPRSAALLTAAFAFLPLLLPAQKAQRAITEAELRAHVAFLASDSLQGRMTGSPGLTRAGEYIEAQFERMGLKPWPGNNGQWRQPVPIPDRIRRRLPEPTEEIFNVIGYLEGKRKDEYVIYSAHYDHVGVRKTDKYPTDSIYNGADDDASGTAAMLEIAEYYALGKKPERSILFIGFTAEEVGLVGSAHFGTTVVPAKVVAMVNIEMVGRPAMLEGKPRVFATGFTKSNLPELLVPSMAKAGIPLQPDPFPDQNLFLRSDNASLARLGVPAHTFGASELQPYYHTPDDELETLNLENMTRIVRGLAEATRGIVAGKLTPTRVDPNTAEKP